MSNKNLNIVHIVRQYYPSMGGMEDVVRNIAFHQKNTGNHNPRIVTLDRLFRGDSGRLETSGELDGIKISRIPYRGSDRYPIACSVLSQLDAADVVHVHGVDFFFDYLALTRFLHKKPLLLSTHGGFFHTQFASRLKKIYFNSITRCSVRAYDAIIGTSENDGQIFSRITPPDRLHVIENGVNVEKYAGRAAGQVCKTMIYFGRWSANKGLEPTLALFARLLKQDPEWKLIIAGREYDYTQQQLQQKAIDFAVAEQVSIIANPSDGALAEAIGRASYFICLSEHEGFGMAPIEAMSAGLLPILSGIPPFKRLERESGMVLMCTQDSQQDSQAILKTHAHHAQNYAAQRAALMQFSVRYGWQSAAQRYQSIYDAVIR
ncbi:glycosyltransferase family 4 protein [Aquitalea sp. LB_tupeE]|uniref:glycosyltransferase family 4 protein n=1 Tax=Aquitalea sp. LB_tupeE TaxID=2748078 RepID=UPI0015BA30BF|nr:glycosyltransferase family 4 protein [Aquitalea sp. LB_tupeE]NWK79437.1 glycosyltransferase family 4 protein [Aquitalea sp. LB_tupeE]